MKANIQTPEFRKVLENHLSMLKPYKNKKDVFTAEIRVHGYSNIVYNIADLLKVSIMALDSENSGSASPAIMEPNLNILGVLEMVLALLPYEEFELLDILHKELLDNPIQQEVVELGFCYSTQRLLGAGEQVRDYTIT